MDRPLTEAEYRESLPLQATAIAHDLTATFREAGLLPDGMYFDWCADAQDQS